MNFKYLLKKSYTERTILLKYLKISYI